MILGALAGYGFGKLMVWIVNKIKLDVDGLYPVLILSMVFFTFSLTDAIGGNGFLAVYISALILGNSHFIHKKNKIENSIGIMDTSKHRVRCKDNRCCTAQSNPGDKEFLPEIHILGECHGNKYR